MAHPLDPVIIRVSRGWCIFFVVFPGTIGLILFGISVIPLWHGTIIGLFVGMMIVALCLLALAIYHIGLAVNLPIALRIDQHGLSGYHIDTVAWDEIQFITAVRNPNQAACLAIKVHDPVALRASQTTLSRFRSWMKRGDGVDLVVADTLFKGASAEEVAVTAQLFKDAHDARSTAS